MQFFHIINNSICNAQVTKLRKALADAKAEIARLQAEIMVNDGVLAEAESALVTLVAEKEALEQRLDSAYVVEQQAADGMQSQMAAFRTHLGAPSSGAVTSMLEANSKGSYNVSCP